MVMRVTNNMRTQSAKDNIFRISEKLGKTQEKLVTGKKVNRPSDDPIAMRQIISNRTDIASDSQYIRNSEYARNFLTQTDSAVVSLQNIADAARSLAMQHASSLPNAKQRASASSQVDLWMKEAVSLANKQFGSRYIFGGQSTALSPLQNTGTEISYVGDNSEINVEVNQGTFVGINLPGSGIFAADINPDIDANTSIATFHRGSGVAAGNISITNTLGATATIAIAAGATVGQVLTQINSSGLGVTASINSTGDGISLTDANANPTGNLLVQDVGNGTTARDLGIIGNTTQTINGVRVQAAATAATSVALLNGGNGLSISDVTVINAGASGTVTFGNPTTVQDILNAFNNSGLNIQATLNSVGNALNLTSTVAGYVPVVLDIGSGTMAAELGLGGTNNLFYTLNALKNAMQNNDNMAIAGLMENLGSISQHLSSVRGTMGGRTNMINSGMESLAIAKENSTELIALAENDDFAASATDLAALETALNASLATTAKILQPTLVDFLR